ncbi:hypothetical protein LEP1GSC193_2623 [Leptospira alstonii serovar Pingchang str. 80-412]|uniref:Uncharacterized protein n=2 Tax=Leptospira alstonii TaxID=28452 RepID=M6D1P4_9LEPT|nr:hypothetical protein LEP1GSC194_2663 [Leptospira alstonii serovar Sichuan str. 79601]EQA80876.1 hypothetical protein LEP1GSC193_2623 [Leptospira alstonii serovar Pingchang str. 80-412]
MRFSSVWKNSMLFPYKSFLKRFESTYFTSGLDAKFVWIGNSILWNFQGKENPEEGPNDRRRIVRINPLS